MLKRLDLLFWLLLAIVLGRLFSMAIVPVHDTTEARYSEIARVMAETGDWITPWFNSGVPFWGKPPLSFWFEALSFRLFGVTEFAVRLPSWLANLGVLALIYTLMRKLADQRQALIATLIFSTMSLSYLLSGGVLTDPFLSLGVTLSFVSIILALKTPGSFWRWWFFVGLAIGLLAKGPLVFVLVGGPLFLWIIWRRQWRDIYSLPWLKGLFLTALLSLPWYIAAELKTPGFINYFIIGEHFLRFVDSGWQGDLYGSAHDETHGTIWLHWLWASFPWGAIAIGVLIWGWVRRKKQSSFFKQKLNDEQRLLLLAALFPSLFFTFSGNILWTYQLPALAPLAMLIAMLLANPIIALSQRFMITTLAIVPLLTLFAGFYAHVYVDQFNTEKTLVAYYDTHKNNETPPLIYVEKVPFSARFYSKGDVSLMALSEVKSLISHDTKLTYFVAVRNQNAVKAMASLPGQIESRMKNNRYTLLQIINRTALNQME